MVLAARNRARTSVRIRRLQTTCRETTCHAPEEVEALKGSMKATGGNPSAPRRPVPVRGKPFQNTSTRWSLGAARRDTGATVKFEGRSASRPIFATHCVPLTDLVDDNCREWGCAHSIDNA